MSLLRCFLNDTCQIFPYLREGAGEPLYGDPEPRRCRLDEGIRLRADLTGLSGTVLEAPGGARLFLEGDPVPVKSRVVVRGRDFAVTACHLCEAFSGHHVELELA